MQTGEFSNHNPGSEKESTQSSQSSNEVYTRTGSTEHNDYRIKPNTGIEEGANKQESEKDRKYNENSGSNKPEE